MDRLLSMAMFTRAVDADSFAAAARHFAYGRQPRPLAGKTSGRALAEP